MAKLFVAQRDVPMIERTAEEIRNRFSPLLLANGYDYFLNHRVFGLHVDDDWVAEAEVKDSRFHYVVIHMANLRESTCTCRSMDYCEHMAATIFAIYKRFSLSMKSLMLDEATKPPANNPVPKASQQGSTASSKKRVASKRSSAPSETDSINNWHYFFTKKQGKGVPAAYIIETLNDNLKDDLLKPSRDWQPLPRSLYNIHVLLFLMNVAEMSYRQSDGYYYFPQYQNNYFRLMRQWTRELFDLILGIDREKAIYSIQEQLLGTIEYVAKLTFAGPAVLVDWLKIYRMLWWNLFRYEPWIANERRRLEDTMNSSGSGEIRDAMTIALAHFNVMDGNDKRATSLLQEQLSHVDPVDFFDYAQTFQSLGQEDRLLYWLRWLLPFMGDVDPQGTRMYLEYWEKASSRIAVEAEWKAAMRSLLPTSFPFYAEYALKHESYREWVELHIICNIFPDSADKTIMRKIAAKHTAALLPYYHQTIERCILEKNREAYKWAVELLVKLRELYVKLRDEQRWSHYMSNLAERHSRLRAFQEELKKGKLVT